MHPKLTLHNNQRCVAEIEAFKKCHEAGYWARLLGQLQRDGLLPSIVFSFSKARCDEIAFGLAGRLSLIEPSGAAEVAAFCDECLLRVRPEERSLPQLVRTRSKLRIADVRWLTSFEFTRDAHLESTAITIIMKAATHTVSELSAGLPMTAVVTRNWWGSCAHTATATLMQWRRMALKGSKEGGF